MHQDVLRIAVAVLQHTQQLDQLGVDAVDADLDDGALTGLADRFFDLLLGLAHDLLDAARMNPAVGDEPFQRDPRDFAPDRIVARDHDRLGRIVDDDIDPGGGFDGADVAPFTTNDAALHLVVGQRQHGDRALGDEFAGQALDRDRDDALGAAVGFLARLLLDYPDLAGCVMARLPHHLFDPLAARFVASQSGDRLEFSAGRLDQLLTLGLAVGQAFFFRAEGLVAPVKLGLAPLERLQALVDTLLAGRELALQRGQLTVLLAHLTFGLRAHLHYQILGL